MRRTRGLAHENQEEVIETCTATAWDADLGRRPLTSARRARRHRCSGASR